jgi:hypothetical protein
MNTNYSIFVSGCGIQGEFDGKNKKQLQGDGRCCGRLVPEAVLGY